MRVAYFGNDIFLDCFRYLANGGRFRVLKLFSVAYGEQEHDFAHSTRRLALGAGIPVQATPALPGDLEALDQQGCEAIISAAALTGMKASAWASAASMCPQSGCAASGGPTTMVTSPLGAPWAP